MSLQAGGPIGKTILGLLGIVVADLDVLLGAQCSPLSIVGVLSGQTCSATPICCENNSIVSDPSKAKKSADNYAYFTGWLDKHWMYCYQTLNRQIR